MRSVIQRVRFPSHQRTMATSETTTTQPAEPLSRLAIERGTAPVRRRRPFWKRWWFWAPTVIVAGAVALFVMQRGRPAQVEIGTVAAAYPSQSIAVLNATGRVSAAR